MQNGTVLSASIICADLLDLQKDLQALHNQGLDYLHFDIMDGHFVPGLGLSLDLMRQLAKRQPIPVEAHLMVTDPEKHIPAVAEAGAAMITFHFEAQPEAGRLAERIRGKGLKAGLALNPETPVSVLGPLLDVLDLVLIMCYPPSGPSREPLPATGQRVADVQALAVSRTRPDLLIAVDGGLSEQYIARFRAQGANFFVLGTTGLFKPAVRLEEQLKRVQAVLHR
jgi:ribulose-phosphate 3-epimerase